MDFIKNIAVNVSRKQKKSVVAPNPGPLAAYVGSKSQLSPMRLIDIAAERRPVPKHTHKFAVGEHVQMLSGARASDRASGACIVVRQIPFEGKELQYRVKSASETHDRIVAESFLQAISAQVAT